MNRPKDSHRQENTKHKQRASHGPTFPPEEKQNYSRVPKRSLLSFPTGFKLLVFFVVVLSLGFAGVAAVPARVPTCSVGEEMSPSWFDPMPTSK